MKNIPASPIIYGDGIHDDTPAVQAMVDGRPIMRVDGRIFTSPYSGLWDDSRLLPVNENDDAR